jgi:hypothetical protein
MNELPKNWFTEMPFDYEFKYYTLLAQIKRIEGNIDDFKLLTSLKNIESSLSILYDIKYAKDGEKDNVKIVGIDFENMEIEYDYPEDTKLVESMYDLCDVAIDKYEIAHKSLRTKWRNVADLLRLSNIGVNVIKNHGFLYLIHKDNLITYEINIPFPYKTSWKAVHVKHIKKSKYNLKNLSKFIEEQEDGVKHYRCDISIDIPINDCAIPVLKSILYKNLI